MEEQEVRLLIKKYLDGTASIKEQAAVNAWYNLKAAENIKQPFAEELLKSEGRVWAEINRNISPVHTRMFPYRKLAAVAAALIGIAVCIWLYSYRHNNHSNDLMKYAKNIKPGKNIATLIVNGGEAITLSESKSGVIITDDNLSYNDGSLVQNSSRSHFSGPLKGDQKNTGTVGAPSPGAYEKLTITTPRGGTYQVRLPDGTNVWLNTASSLTYKTAAKAPGALRIAQLSGEAYFEVAKDKAHPFIVKSESQEITVLGTHFNVNAYGDRKATKTTLLEGSVKISSLLSPSRGEEKILRPNQQSLVSVNQGITVKQVDADDAIAWKNGYFSFQNTPIQEVMTTLAAWYDMEVVFDKNLKPEGYTGKFSRNRNIGEVLRMLEKTRAVRFTITERRVTVHQ